jgi:hypothetical protein
MEFACFNLLAVIQVTCVVNIALCGNAISLAKHGRGISELEHFTPSGVTHS